MKKILYNVKIKCEYLWCRVWLREPVTLMDDFLFQLNAFNKTKSWKKMPVTILFWLKMVNVFYMQLLYWNLLFSIQYIIAFYSKKRSLFFIFFLFISSHHISSSIISHHIMTYHIISYHIISYLVIIFYHLLLSNFIVPIVPAATTIKHLRQLLELEANHL